METRWLQSIADTHGFPRGIVAYAELERDNVEEILASHARYPNIRGIRQILNWHEDPVKNYATRPDYMTDRKWLAGYALLEKYHLSFGLQIYPWQMIGAAKVAQAHPGIQVILNHTGMSVERDPDAIDVWRSGMRTLAAVPNVAVKISGLGMVDWHWTVASIRPFVLTAIDYFGIDRCMFASNFPVDKLYSDYDTLYDAFKLITADFSEAEQRKLFHDNAARIYRL